MLDKMGKFGSAIVNLFFLFMLIFIIVRILGGDSSIGVKIIVLIPCGGLLWWVIDELITLWKKEE